MFCSYVVRQCTLTTVAFSVQLDAAYLDSRSRRTGFVATACRWPQEGSAPSYRLSTSGVRLSLCFSGFSILSIRSRPTQILVSRIQVTLWILGSVRLWGTCYLVGLFHGGSEFQITS